MTDQERHWAALLAADDEENQVDSPEKPHDSKSAPAPVSTVEMTDQEKHWAALLAAADEENQNNSPEKPSDSKSQASTVATEELVTGEMPATDELPIYEATPAQINYWHSYGSNVSLQTLLREYDLDHAAPNVAAYNHFKIGVDTRRHVATFAIDATHYLAIDFNQWNSAPLDRTQAQRILEEISAIRMATRRFKDFCGVQIEYFD